MDKLVLRFPPQHTDLYFDLTALTQICHSHAKRGALLVDASLINTYGAAIHNQLGYDLIPVPSGENHKTRETKQALEDELFKRNFGRDSLLIAVGGGVTTDLVGFLASTYMRGVPLILIPTTLLAMVDAAIGGKTAVDTHFGKNTIGSFYLPKAIFIDTHFLTTLPEKEVKNGLSEILKYGLIADAAIWHKAAHWKQELLSLIRASIACKIHIVEQDFEEKTGLRRILNFGHTVGHALELTSQFRIAHGEAVAIGCMAESYLSHLLGYLPKETFESIIHLYQKLGYRFISFEPKAFLEAMNRDKKARGGMARFVLIDQIGHPLPFQGEYCQSVKPDILEKMISWMNHD